MQDFILFCFGLKGMQCNLGNPSLMGLFQINVKIKLTLVIDIANKVGQRPRVRQLDGLNHM